MVMSANFGNLIASQIKFYSSPNHKFVQQNSEICAPEETVSLLARTQPIDISKKENVLTQIICLRPALKHFMDYVPFQQV